MNKNLFIGIDPGGKNKKTSGICVLIEKEKGVEPLKPYCLFCQDLWGREIFKIIKPFLPETKVIAIDAPLTRGQGKGKMRLYEKFLSQKVFREKKIAPLPPALIPQLMETGIWLRRKLEAKGFILGPNLIETFPTLVKEIVKKNLFFQVKPKNCQTKNQRSALICALIAYLHFHFQTRYLGYRDGFLFLPEIKFWKKNWQEKFFYVWQNRHPFKYKYLTTNLFKKFK